MAHLSLYRRFRPAVFEEMVRQEHVVRVLKNQVESGSVGHAYLFCGPRGTGKTTVARIFARSVNCLHPVNGSPCGTCEVCRALGKDSLDIVEIDAASNNGVNEMRDLREKVQYPPVAGKYKVYIIDEVHMLTDSAFNALLKTLEEPPAHAIFILATTEPHKIPATILSRCMRLDFKLIPEEDLEKHLVRILEEIGKPYEREAISAIARAGAGSDRDMLSIAEMCLAYGDALTYEGVNAVLGSADFFETCTLCEAMLAAELSATLEQAEKILSQGKSVGVLCRDLLESLNRISIAKTCATAEKLLALPKNYFERIRSIASAADGYAILRAIQILSKAETDLRFVSSPRICLETALMKIALPSADKSEEVLLVRIGRLERQIKEFAEGAKPRRSSETAEPRSKERSEIEPRLTERLEIESRPTERSEIELRSTERSEIEPRPTERSEIELRSTERLEIEPRPTERSKIELRSKERSEIEPAREQPEYAFPSEEPIFEEAIFSDAPVPEPSHPVPKEFISEQPARPVQKESVPESARPVQKESVREASILSEASCTQAPKAQGAEMTAEFIFGKFIRLLRKNSRNGVLFTMCADLEARFDGALFVLETGNATIHRSLNREEHLKSIAEVLLQLGIERFEIRLKGAAEKGPSAEEQLRRDFKDYPIEVK